MPRTAKKIEPPTTIGGCHAAVGSAWSAHMQLRILIGQLLGMLDDVPDNKLRLILNDTVRRSYDDALKSAELWEGE